MKFFCKFSRQDILLKDIFELQKLNVDILLFKDVNNTNILYLFYPYNKNKNNKNDTIILHKKHQTFFTINALNSLTNYHNSDIIPWELYINNLIILKQNKIHIIDIVYYIKLHR